MSNVLAVLPSSAFPHIRTILDSVAIDLSCIPARVKAFKTGLPLFPDSENSSSNHEKLCLEHVHNSLVILDLYLINVDSGEDKGTFCKRDLLELYGALPSQLISIILLSDIIRRGKFSDSLRSLGKVKFPYMCHFTQFYVQVNQCSDLAFRVLINVTNGSASWSEAIMTETYTLPTLMRLISSSYLSVSNSSKKAIASVNDGEDHLSVSMDRLCLALALLTNLVQEVEKLGRLLQDYSKFMRHSSNSSVRLL